MIKEYKDFTFKINDYSYLVSKNSLDKFIEFAIENKITSLNECRIIHKMDGTLIFKPRQKFNEFEKI